MKGVLEVDKGLRTTSEHSQVPLNKVLNPHAQIGLCDELVTQPGVDLPSHIVYPSHDPKRG